MEWISVSERLPDVEGHIQVIVYAKWICKDFVDNGICIADYYLTFGHPNWTTYTDTQADEITHWMLLPEPPEM